MSSVTPESLALAAQAALKDSLKVLPGESVVIITNPGLEAYTLSQALYQKATLMGAKPLLVVQDSCNADEEAHPAVIGALGSEPQVFISISEKKLGKDGNGLKKPYRYGGRRFSHISELLIAGKGCSRGFWAPGITVERFCEAVPLNYEIVSLQCWQIKRLLDEALALQITAPGGTDIQFSVKRQGVFLEDGNFTRKGRGGSLPTGEVFLFPVPGTAHGRIVYDGSIVNSESGLLLTEPIDTHWEAGFMKSLEGGDQGQQIEEMLSRSESTAQDRENRGFLPRGRGSVYGQNARSLGEFGIGLNPQLKVRGEPLLDQKVLGACHFSLGNTRGSEAPSVLQLDGLVMKPTIRLILPGEKELVLFQEGQLMVHVEKDKT